VDLFCLGDIVDIVADLDTVALSEANAYIAAAINQALQ
jgi:hypothetical protein